MLSLHKTTRVRSLRGSTAQTGTQRRAHRRPSTPTYSLSGHRDFSWGSKHKYCYPHAGKVWKGFSTHDACRTAAWNQLYRSTFCIQQYPLRRYLPRDVQPEESRLSSSWGKPGSYWTKENGDDESKCRPEEKYADWFSRWQRRKEERYGDFAKRIEQKENRYSELMKKIEEDPYGVLFGRSWIRWADGPQLADTTSSAASVPKEPSSPEAKLSFFKEKLPRQDEIVDKQPKTVATETLSHEYEIDPITMRKVPKKAPIPVSPAFKAKVPAKGAQEGFDIPIKRFRSPSTDLASNQQESRSQKTPGVSSHSSPTASPLSKDTKSCLAQEGFGNSQARKADVQLTLKTDNDTPESTPRKMESALDRHLQRKGTAKEDAERLTLRYQPKANTAEDINLLRPSDVRACAGLRGKPAQETDLERRARQRKLEEDYDRRTLDRESQLAQELATGEPERGKVQMPDTAVSKSWVNEVSDNEPYVLKDEDAAEKENVGSSSPSSTMQKPIHAAFARSDLKTALLTKVDKIKTQIVPMKARLDALKAHYDTLRQRWLEENRRQKVAKRASEIHEEEVKEQKRAMAMMEMRGAHKRDTAVAQSDESNKKPNFVQLQNSLPGEGDMASNVHEFASRDRWYKRKAPHARDEIDAKPQQLAKDKALIREVRSIYEDTYGTIDTKHRQPSLSDWIKPLSPSEGEVPSATVPTSDPAAARSAGLTSEYRLQDLGDTQGSDALVIIQKLFNELYQAQDLIRNHRSSFQQSESTDEASSMLRAVKSYERTVLQIAKSALSLAKGSPGLPGNELAQGLFDAGAVARSAKPTVARALPSLGPEPAESPTSTTPRVYRILAYDPATQKVVSSPKTSSLSPFSKEQPLMPVEALEVVNNPGKFLPHLMTLHNKGYNVVSGTSNVLVFKKEATGDELAAAKHAEAVRYPNPIDGTIASTGNFASPTGFVNHDSPIPLEELKQHHAVAEASPNLTSEPPLEKQLRSNKVRREEDVFSGGSRGGWQEKNDRRLKNKKQRGHKSTFKRMLLTGTLTAACCYAVGVASEMMRH